MRVVVTGMGIISAAGRGVEAFARAIQAGTPGDRPAPHLLAPEHQARVAAVFEDPEIATEQPGEDDRVFRVAAEALDEALASAQLGDVGLPASDTALIVGTSLGGMIAAQSWHRQALAGEDPPAALAAQIPLHRIADDLAGRHGWTGPRTTVSNACVSGTNALGLGLDMLRSGECEAVVAGGVDTLHSFNFCGFATLWALTSEKCRPFDPTRTGMLLGEAAAFLILEPAERALERVGPEGILAEIAGYGSSPDAVHITAPDRTGGGAARAIGAALEDAGLTQADVDFVSLHGTGTVYFDGMEAAAMGRVFGERVDQVPAFSLRPVTGHTLASAGAVDSVACLLGLTRGFIPATPHHQELDPGLAAPVRVITEALRQPSKVAINTCSGFAGSNASVVFRRWEDAS